MPEVEFEQPDLRTTQGKFGSTYQHPHTNEIVPSVTTISGLIDKSSFLTPWAAKTAAWWVADNMDVVLELARDPDALVGAIKAGSEAERDKKRNLGSLAHGAIENLLHGHPAHPPEVAHHIKGFSEWCQRYVREIVANELTVWSHRHHYAGTLDLLVRFHDGRLILVDIKTGNVYEEAALQVTALARADVVVTTDGDIPMPKIDGAGILHVPDNILTPGGRPSAKGKWSYREVPMRESEWETFLALRRAKKWESEEARTAIGGKQTMPAIKAVQ